MTSMPASRSARAMTLAPRSCPSRPGLATSTRIFCSAMQHHLNTERTRDHSGQPAPDLPLKCFDVQAAPHVPAGYAAIWFPGARDLFHVLGFRQLPFAIMPLQRHLHAIITCREHIEPAQREDQEHMRGPHANAFDLSQMCDDFLVRQLGKF